MDVFNAYDITELCNHCQDLVSEIRDHGDHSCTPLHFSPFNQTSSVVRDALKKAFEEVCERHIDATVCSEYVRSFGDIIIDSARFEGVSPLSVCQRYAMCPFPLDQDALNTYVAGVLQGKPAVNATVPTGRSTYRVLHITDIHTDFLYQEVHTSLYNM